jgi:hypothetical protein
MRLAALVRDARLCLALLIFWLSFEDARSGGPGASSEKSEKRKPHKTGPLGSCRTPIEPGLSDPESVVAGPVVDNDAAHYFAVFQLVCVTSAVGHPCFGERLTTARP